jgi:mono/diheme cytochrome c family protein
MAQQWKTSLMPERLRNTSAYRGRRFLAAILVAIAAAVPLILVACLPYDWVGSYEERSFGSNGERIYFTAASESGERITNSGGSFMMHHRVACVSCHGPGGEGGRVSMMMWGFSASNITWETLTQQERHDEEPSQGQHEEHPPYAEETLKRAIIEGIDPAGELLKAEMPRWRISEDDLDDLVEFIKTLG